MSAFTVTLPWPNPKLSPNARGNWKVTQGPKRQAREQGRVIALQALSAQSKPPRGPLQMEMWFCPPSNHRRDIDNLLASMKSALDGVFDAIKRNDHEVIRTTICRGKKVEHGQVQIVISPVTTEESNHVLPL